jgi:hypothetical protein
MIQHFVAIAAVLFSTLALATTWDETEIVDPIRPDAVCNVHEPTSSGSYVYQWPSKYDQVFWPLTVENGIWHCKDSGFTAFIGDFEGIAAAERNEIINFLSAFQPTADSNSIEHKLILLERLYGIRHTDRDFDNKLWRVLARWYQESGDFDTANSYRAKAYSDLRQQLKDEIPEAKKLEYLYLAANYARQFGDEPESEKYLTALIQAIDNVEDKELKGYAEYLAELALDTPRISPGGKLDPESDRLGGT